MLRLILALALWSTPLWAEPELLSVTPLPTDIEGFSGLSGIETGPEGTPIWLISDGGFAFRGEAERSDGALTFTLKTGGPLKDTLGRDMWERTAWKDSVGLALGDDGSLFISFERNHRLWRYPDLGVPPLKGWDIPASAPPNGGVEALAIDAQGRLFAMIEAGQGTLWRLDENGWAPMFGLPQTETFNPVGADFGPDGHLYVLERAFTRLRFAAQVLRVDMSTGLTEVVLSIPSGRHGNLEGLAVWEDGDGLRLTMVSDDNENVLQRSEIVEYRLTD